MSEENVLSLQRESPEDDTEAEPQTWGTRQERERCRILSLHVRRLAGRSRAVRGLRETLFGDADGTISRGRAFALLESPATHYLGPRFFEAHKIPFASHESKLEKRTLPRKGMARIEHVRLKVWRPGATPVLAERRVTMGGGRGIHPPRWVQIPSRRRVQHGALAHEGSWLRIIAQWAERIAKDFLWSEAEAIRFALTGQAPSIDPVSAHFKVATDGRGAPVRPEIILRVQPFVSMKTIERAMAARRFSLGRRFRLGPPLALRTLAVFDFVEDARAREGWEAVPWARLVKRWDGTERGKRRGWGYRADRGNFRRDYERIRKLLIEEYMTPRHRNEKAWAEAQRAREDS
jgi:hypothetical protein